MTVLLQALAAEIQAGQWLICKPKNAWSEMQAANLVIEMLAADEVALRERLAEVEAERDLYRERVAVVEVQRDGYRELVSVQLHMLRAWRLDPDKQRQADRQLTREIHALVLAALMRAITPTGEAT